MGVLSNSCQLHGFGAAVLLLAIATHSHCTIDIRGLGLEGCSELDRMLWSQGAQGGGNEEAIWNLPAEVSGDTPERGLQNPVAISFTKGGPRSNLKMNIMDQEVEEWNKLD